MSKLEVPLNRRAYQRCAAASADRLRLRIAAHDLPSGAKVLDFGVAAEGGLEAGRRLAEICLAGLGRVALVPSHAFGQTSAHSPAGGAAVQVTTDQPIAACMASQYAGWQIVGDKFFAMGSGPMRALARREPLFESLGVVDPSDVAVGVLEAARLPPDEVCRDIAAECGVAPEKLTLCVAPTASIAGTLQVVARSVETALHKLHELGFPLDHVRSGFGIAPLPPVAKNDLAAIGRTNDAILYGGQTTLWVRCDDDDILAFGPRVPSGASSDHGRPFAEIFARYGGDFYKIDPLLFSPAVVAFQNLKSGHSFRFGKLEPQVLAESFEIES
ncbi:MAG: methenyltetrahydromethanopterin cyclohydrolase [Planctomycetota bacterium]|nr:MAG: methenyltetrahydromethanopterin cyclohydrolase [Planctomycetota bacterium]